MRMGSFASASSKAPVVPKTYDLRDRWSPFLNTQSIKSMKKRDGRHHFLTEQMGKVSHGGSGG